MPRQWLTDRIPAHCIPQAQSIVATARNDAPPIRAESDTVNRVRVPFQWHTDGIPARGIPQAQIGVQTARDDTLAVGAKSDATHCTAIFDRLTDGIPGTGIP